MKFLNTIDGASKIITDSLNQFVTQAEKDEIAKVKDKADKGQVLTDVPSGAKFTDTIYTHPTTAGNKHIPTGGTTGQILRHSSSGTAIWGNENNTIYTAGQGLILTGTELTPDFGNTAGKVTQGNDPRLSDARTPLAHNQAISTITGLQGALDGKVNNSQVLTNVPANAKFTDTIVDISGKADINYVDNKVKTDVPLGAKFTDTTYGVATTSNNGLMSNSDKTNLNSNTTARHTHSNISTLDKLIEVGDELKYNGETVVTRTQFTWAKLKGQMSWGELIGL